MSETLNIGGGQEVRQESSMVNPMDPMNTGDMDTVVEDFGDEIEIQLDNSWKSWFEN